jgi:hypothetical protein
VDHQASHGRCFMIYPTPLSCDYVRLCEIMWDYVRLCHEMLDMSTCQTGRNSQGAGCPAAPRLYVPAWCWSSPLQGRFHLRAYSLGKWMGGAGKIWKLRDQSWKLNK